MHDNYLTNIESYLCLEKYILNTFMEHTSKKNIKANYLTPFYKTTYNNGQLFRDANPIFSAQDTNSKQVIRIIISEDEQEVHIIKKSTEHGVGTVVFGRISNLHQILGILREWAA